MTDPVAPVLTQPVLAQAAALPKDAQVVAVLLGAGGLAPAGVTLDKAAGGAIGRALAARPGKMAAGDCLDLWALPGLAHRRVVVLSLGDGAQHPGGALGARKAGGALAAHLEGEAEVTLLADAPAGTGLPAATLAEALALGFALRGYRLTLKGKGTHLAATRLTVVTGEAGALPRAEAMAEGVALARQLVDLPSNILNPDTFADYLAPLAKAGVSVEVLETADLEQMGAGAILAVGGGARRPPRMIVLRLNPDAKGAPLAFVGKGVCFDSGGLCMKSGEAQWDMKGDMAGAAAVAGLMLTLARQGWAGPVVGVLGVAENLPGPAAYKSGDVIRTLSGKTVEVFDTDCEGRMILADCLCYTATRFRPAAMVDLATLTYSVMRGLGSHFAGLFASDRALSDGLIAAGERTGERLWPLPLDAAYDAGLTSALADLRQHGKDFEDGDAPHAAAFLRHFTENVPWAHLDIAGKEFWAEDGTLGRKGARGFGVQLLADWVAARGR